MKLSIVHFSDIHFNNQRVNFLLSKKTKLISALKNEMLDCSKIIFIITGDIAQKGIEEEYKIAKKFFIDIRNDLEKYTNKKIDYLIVPGNHDNYYEDEDVIRDSLIATVYEKIKKSEIISDKLIEEIIKPQKYFKEFSEDLLSKCMDKQIYNSLLQKTYHFELENTTVIFNLFNTSWISKLGNDAGKLLFPTEKIVFNDDLKENFKISLMHHNFNWFDPNNSRNFKEKLEVNSDLILTGHEHTRGLEKRIQINDTNLYEVEHFEGGVLQDTSNESNSEFSLIELDFENKIKNLKTFNWEKQEGIYLPSEKIVSELFEAKKKNKYRIKESFKKEIEDPGLNLRHPRKEKITLQDIFIEPDLTLKNLEGEKIQDKFLKFSDLHCKQDILSERVNFILGEEKSGKTSLLKMLFLKFLEKRKYTLLVDGNDIKSKDFKKIIEETYEKQFGNLKCFSHFDQEDKYDKILLVDDFHKVKKRQQELFLEKASKYFGCCFFSINSFFELEYLFKTEINYNRIEVNDFDEEKRYLLVNKWERLENESLETEIVNKIHKTKNTLDISIVNNITPSRPMFLITSLLTFETNNTLKLEESSRGYYYEFLIIQSISKITIENDEIVGFFAFLSNLAYYYYENKSLQLREVAKFHRKYIEENDISPAFRGLYDFNRLMDSLIEINLMSMKSTEYKFKYNYIYYYFVSKYFSDNLTMENIKNIVTEICEKMYLESNANIILFLTHHSKDPFVIEEVLGRANDLFKDEEPIQFEEDINHLNKLISSLPQFQIKEEENYHENRIEEYKNNNKTPENSYEKEDIEDRNLGNEFNLAFKTVEIIGNILKNHHSSLNGKRKKEILKVAFELGFRTNKFLFNIFGEDIEFQLERLTKNNLNSSDYKGKPELLEYAKNVTFYFTNMISFFILLNMGRSLGDKKLSVTYEKIEENDMKSNATSLLNLIMKLEYSSSFPVDEVSKIYKKLKNNNFSCHLLKSIVIRQMRLFPIKREEKQAICSLLDVNIKKENLIELKIEEMKQQ